MARYPTVVLFDGPTRLGTLNVDASAVSVGDVLQVATASPLSFEFGPGGGGGGSGDVVGPASAGDNRIARFDGTTGKLIQNSAVTIDDAGNVSGVGSLTLGTALAVNYGGTGATTAAAARAALGLAIGSDVQAYSVTYVTAASTFAVDNSIIRADGTGRGTQTSSVDVNDSGALLPRTTDTQQAGNKDLRWQEVWSRQYSGTTQSAVQAPSGGWTSSQWAIWSNASGVPKHTHNGADATLLRDSDVGTTVQAQDAVLEALSDLSTLSGAATRISSVVIRLGSLIPRAGGVSEWGIVTAIVAGTVAYNSTAIRALRPWAQSRYTFTNAGACYVAATQASSSEIFQCSRLDEYYVSGGFALSSTASPVRGGFGWVGALTTLYETRTSALLSARACLEGGTLYAVLGDGTTNSNTAFLTALSADTNYRIGVRMRSGTTSFFLMNAVGTVLETKTLSVDLLSLTTTFATVGEGFICTSAATQYMYPNAIFIDQDE